jgi:8-oxo-dGTP diphosphatase
MSDVVPREYPNLPQVAVGAIVVKDGRVLLVQRGQAPSQGLWAIPGGRLELGETLQQAAEREILEETGIQVRAGEPYLAFDVIDRDDRGRVHFHYVIVDMLAEYLSGEPRAAGDARAVGWFSWPEVQDLPVNPKTMEVVERLLNR